MATGSNKTLPDSYYHAGKLYAGKPCAMGYNLTPPYYWRLSGVYVDLIKHTAGWSDNDGAVVALNTDGWVTSVDNTGTKILIWHDTSDIAEVEYIIEWTGTGTVDFNYHSTKINVEMGTNSAVVTVLDATGNPHFWLQVKNGSLLSCSMHRTDAADAFNAGQIWSDEFRAQIGHNNIIRFMDSMSTNNSSQQHASDIPSTNYMNYTTHGVSPEAVAQLCNYLDASPWTNAPHKFTNDWATAWYTRLKVKLNSHLKVRSEYSNEVVFNYNSAFYDQWSWVRYPSLTPQYAVVSGNVMTKTAHGLITGDEIRSWKTSRYSSFETRTSHGRESYIIKLTDDTYSIAHTTEDAGNGTAIDLPADMVEHTFKITKGIEMVDGTPEIISRSDELWAIVDGIFGERSIHVRGSQSASAGVTESLVTNDLDIIGIAPYVSFQGMPEFWLKSNAEILAYNLAQLPSILSDIRAHFEYFDNIVCYEAGTENFHEGNSDLDKLKQAKNLEFYRSEEMETLYLAYCKMLADAHLPEVCLFATNAFPFGSHEFMNITRPDRKAAAIADYQMLGFPRN